MFAAAAAAIVWAPAPQVDTQRQYTIRPAAAAAA